MKKSITLIFSTLMMALSACAPQATALPTQSPTDEPTVIVEIPTPTPTATAADVPTKLYTNNDFGFSFRYPANWFGPDEYISDQTLRLEVGSDVVYPYGNPPDEPSDVKNSYSVVIQYMKNNQNNFYNDTYESLIGMQDGESLSGTRSLITRVRRIQMGRFEGFEYTATLSETAQTEIFFGREILLVDTQSNDLLTIMGQPNNVEVAEGANWREVYQALDQANRSLFEGIVESIMAE